MYLEKPHPYDILEEIDNKLRIDTCNADGTVCDMIIPVSYTHLDVYKRQGCRRD